MFEPYNFKYYDRSKIREKILKIKKFDQELYLHIIIIKHANFNCIEV